MSKNHISRRSFIKLTSFITITSGFNIILNGCDSTYYNWENSLVTNDHNGKLQILQLDGIATSNGKTLRQGDNLENAADITLLEGVMRLSLPDQSVIELNHKAVVNTDLDSRDGGTIHLKKGSMLSVIRKKPIRPIVIKTAEVQFGIRGTVCFTKVLSDKDKLSPRIPESASSYFCICNGKMDYLQQDQKFASDRANHHSSHLIIPEGKNIKLQRAPFLLNHDDRKILQLINKMQGTKHKTNWLFPQKSGYSD